MTVAEGAARRALVPRALSLALDALLLLGVAALGAGVHGLLGAAAACLYAGLVLLSVWYAVAATRPSA